METLQQRRCMPIKILMEVSSNETSLQSSSRARVESSHRPSFNLESRKQVSMEVRPFASTSRQVSVVGQGTWLLEQSDPAGAIAALRHGLDLGMTHIDTAEMYGSGKAEALVGQAIAGHRDEVFLVSKVLPSHASRRGVIAACDASLARLNTDRLDCYLLHWRGRHPLAETIAAFEQLQDDGKILSWGVSNFDVSDLKETCEIARPACNQVLYHLRERAIEHAVLPWCEAHGIAVVAYSPFGHRGGFPGNRTAPGRVLEEIAAAHGATPRQIALRFLVRRASVFAIPKASTSLHVEENAAAGNLQLSPADIARIEAAFPLGTARELPML
jgi:diketogulonate reductase-like aldo/keto reductase